MPLAYQTHEAADMRDMQTVDAGLDEYNHAIPELHQVRKLSVFARDEQNEIRGGAIGRTWGQCCELQQLWVSDIERGRGVGTELMARFENEAKRRGCVLVYLDTFSFQACPFYEKSGYRVVLETKGFPNGIIKYTMQKSLPPTEI